MGNQSSSRSEVGPLTLYDTTLGMRPYQRNTRVCCLLLLALWLGLYHTIQSVSVGARNVLFVTCTDRLWGSACLQFIAYRNVKLSTHLKPVPRSRMCEDLSSRHLYTFMACCLTQGQMLSYHSTFLFGSYHVLTLWPILKSLANFSPATNPVS
jgi:hypothetical protein